MADTFGLKSFNYLESGEVTYSILDTIETLKVLRPGVYRLGYIPSFDNARATINIDANRESDKIHPFPQKDQLDAIYRAFFSTDIKNKINELGLYHKLGILLYGTEGTGKTTIFKHYYTRAVKENDAIVFSISGGEYLSKIWEFIEKLRVTHKNVFIIVLEEMDGLLQINGNTAFIKSITDGNRSIDNCIFMATTNEINNIPEAIKNRPSRFKYSFAVEGIQDQSVIQDILKGMLGEDANIPKWAEELKGKNLDIIKQFGIDRIMNIQSVETKMRNPIGFGR